MTYAGQPRTCRYATCGKPLPVVEAAKPGRRREFCDARCRGREYYDRQHRALDPYARPTPRDHPS